MSRINTIRLAFAAAMAGAALAGCGGGGGDTTGSAQAASALAGGWEGSSSSGTFVQVVILENGTLLGVGGIPTVGGLAITEVYKISLQASGTTVSSIGGKAYDLATQQSAALTISGSFVPNTSAALTATSGSATRTVSLTAAQAANYIYDTAATAAAVAGSWPGFFTTGDSGTVTVASNGSYSTTTSLGCQISGAIVPRASGKNVYDVSVNLGPAPCALPNTSASGNAVITNLEAGGRQLAVIATTADGVYVAAFFGQR